MSKQTTEEIDIGIEAGDREAVAGMLGKILANQHVLYIKTRNFHWNLRGMRFTSLHAFFEEQYGELEAAIDETAERIRMLGCVSPGSMAEFTKAAGLSETKGGLIDGEEAIAALQEDHEAAARELRGAIEKCEETFEDAGTADFLTGLLRKHEGAAWMLRSLRG